MSRRYESRAAYMHAVSLWHIRVRARVSIVSARFFFECREEYTVRVLSARFFYGRIRLHRMYAVLAQFLYTTDRCKRLHTMPEWQKKSHGLQSMLRRMSARNVRLGEYVRVLSPREIFFRWRVHRLSNRVCQINAVRARLPTLSAKNTQQR